MLAPGDARPHVLLLDIECTIGNTAAAATLLQRIQQVFMQDVKDTHAGAAIAEQV